MVRTIEELREFIKASSAEGLSHDRIAKRLKREGYLGQKTHKPISAMGVRYHLDQMGLLGATSIKGIGTEIDPKPHRPSLTTLKTKGVSESTLEALQVIMAIPMKDEKKIELLRVLIEPQ